MFGAALIDGNCDTVLVGDADGCLEGEAVDIATGVLEGDVVTTGLLGEDVGADDKVDPLSEVCLDGLAVGFCGRKEQTS